MYFFSSNNTQPLYNFQRAQSVAVQTDYRFILSNPAQYEYILCTNFSTESLKCKRFRILLRIHCRLLLLRRRQWQTRTSSPCYHLPTATGSLSVSFFLFFLSFAFFLSFFCFLSLFLVAIVVEIYVDFSLCEIHMLLLIIN
jgi:hypothetical protein